MKRTPSVLAGFAVMVAVVFTFAVCRYIWATAYFYGDDYSTLYFLRTKPLGEVLLIPLGSQIVPLHRLLTLVVADIAPMNFAATLIALGAFHLLAIAYLYRTLELVRPSKVNVVLSSVYATNMFFGFNFGWFSSGTTRFPYIAFSIATLFHFLRYRRTAMTKDLVFVCVCYLLALSFYSKGILIPLYCACADVATAPPAPAHGEERTRVGAYGVLGALLVCSAVYAPLVRRLLDANASRTNTSPRFLFEFVRLAWTTLLNGAVGNPLDVLSYNPNPVLVPASLAFVGYSIWRSRRTAVAWLCLFALVTVNFLVVGVSNRTLLFGHVMAFEPRHFYELWFLVVLFVGIVLHALPRDAPELAWLAAEKRLPVIAGVLALAFAASAVAAFSAFTTLEERNYADVRQTRAFMRTLERELDRVRVSERTPFADSFLPPYLDPMDFEHRRISDLFVAMDVRAHFVPLDRARYRVSANGHVERIR
ncbi:MAG TPA: hypothetical protein VHU80_19880 [Polyangiaceae bacterium]|nr:hypothetical protein [Polyangiaceae bacterium]